MSKFWDDVMEQSKAARNLVSFIQDIREKAKPLSHNRVLFTGMGASFHACASAVLFMKSRGLDAELSELSELVWYEVDHVLNHYDTVVFVSQSGESAELISLLEKHPAFVSKSILVTNNPGSRSARFLGEDRVFEIFAGTERAMGASKTFINTVLCLLTIASEWASEDLPLSSFPETIDNALKTETDVLAESLEKTGLPIIVGRGYSLGVSNMIKLMFSEVPKKNITVYSGGAFRHGPLELIKNDPLIMLLNPLGRTSDLMEKLGDELSDKCRVLMITNAKGGNHPQMKTIVVGQDLQEELAPLSFIIPFQRAAEVLARKAGYDPGEGIYASKVTRSE